MSEQVGRVRPDGVQRLLNHSEWDEDAVRDDVRAYVVETIGAKNGILIGDDTGFLQTGTRSAGVQRQYTGTAGRTENCPIGTFQAGDPAGAAAAFEDLLTDRLRVLGPDHPNTLTTRNNLAYWKKQLSGGH